MCSMLSGCVQKPTINYLNELELIPDSNYNFRLNTPFIVQINHHVIAVPAGFVTDLASTPRLLWSLYSPNNTKTIRAAVVHDYMYRCITTYSRYEADQIFYYALLKHDLSWLTANKYYYGVRLFGWYFYKPQQCL